MGFVCCIPKGLKTSLRVARGHEPIPGEAFDGDQFAAKILRILILNSAKWSSKFMLAEGG